MASIRMDALGFSHEGGEPLFEGVSLTLDRRFTGLVGENGTGKTTLLKLLLGDLEPSSGGLEILPKGGLVVSCPQAVDELSDDVRMFAIDESGVAQRRRGELDLDPADLDRWQEMSPGERKRWQTATALAAEPEVLLLDEPSNHLDQKARTILIDALRRFRGVGVVVSHDRDLLDAITVATVRLHAREAAHYPCSYSRAREIWRADEARRADEQRAHREGVKKTAKVLAQRRRDLTSAIGSLSVSSRSKGPRDHDASNSLRKGMAEAAEKRLGRQVGVVRARLERLVDEAPSGPSKREVGRSVFVGYEPARRPVLLAIDEDRLMAGERVVLHEVHLSLAPTDRVWIDGDNGAGKTTLLGHLCSRSTLPSSKVLYVPQHLPASRARALVAEVRRLPPEARGRVMSLVAALGAPPEKLLSTPDPSPGEARKLLFAMGLGLHVWALVLDEPTNDLDLPSIERLEEALDGYPGALLLVTHDRQLAKRVTTRRWSIESGTVRVS